MATRCYAQVMQVGRFPKCVIALAAISLMAASVRAESLPAVVTPPLVDQPTLSVASPPAVVRPLALPQQVTTPEGPGDQLLSLRKKSVERDHIGYFISGGIITAAGVGLLVGGLALAFNQEPNRESHAFLGTLGIGTTILGSSHLVLGAILLGVGGYRKARSNAPIEPE